VLVIGNSDGIGLATTQLLLDRGFPVTGISRRASPLSHDSYTHIVQDVSAPDYARVLRDVVERDGPFAICIYCAGIGVPFAMNFDADVQVFEVNLLGAVRTAETLLPSMLASQRGHIVVLSSQADELVSSQAPSYSASKAALSFYFEGIGLALRGRGVHVTNVRFGFVDTKMAKASRLPFVITPRKAAQVILRSLERRPLRVTYPLRMALLVRLLRWGVGWKIRLLGSSPTPR
jgi:short-subunit dehydrogenase